MAAEVILRVRVDRSQYNAFKTEVKQGLTLGGAGKTTDALNGMGNAAQGALTKVQTLGEMLTKKIAWYSIAMAITSVTTAFKDAFNEMKKVDTQLTNIQKVSNATAEQLGALADKAYSTASKYGVAASDYMEAVYEYTKAGFQDNADAMAELSTKAMLVGDTTAAVADKFLISANAAWKYGKNVEELSLLVDRADYINNNYATTFDKIADGFPRVASVASMAGMSAEQTMAMLGTITATTQETASRAGTAARALILNILKDTTTEVEEGVTTTQEQIDSLTSALQKYAPEVVKAAEATGSLINPMEALKALSEAYKRGDLTQSGLFQIENALGGKLRTNQLDALLKNFDMYEEMMYGMAGAAGTADKEISIMLTSWESKSRILKNTWTEFISKSVNAENFKGMIDWATQLLERFGSLGEIIPIIGLAFATMITPSVSLQVQKYIVGIKDLVTVIGSLASGASIAGASLANGITAGITIGLAAITTAYTLYQNHIRKIRQESQEAADEAGERADTAKTEFDNVVRLYAEYDTAKTAYERGRGSKEAYTQATETLAAALGIEKDAIKGVEDQLKSLTKTELESKLKEIRAEVSERERNILTQADTYHNTNNRIIESAQRVQASYYQEDPTGLGGVVYEELGTDERIRRAVSAYKATQTKIAALSEAYMAKNYAELNQSYMQGDITSDVAVIAKEAFTKYSKEEINKQLNRLSSDLQEASFVGDYIEALKARAEYEKAWDDFKKGKISAEEAADAELEYAEAEREAAREAAKLAAEQKKVSDAFNEVKGQATSASEAIQKYKDALTTDETQENADALSEAWQAAYEDYEKGLKDSAKINAFADLLMSPETIREIQKRGGSVADELMNNPLFKRLFIAGYETDEETGAIAPIFRDGLDAAKELGAWINEFDTDNNRMITRYVNDTSEIAARLIDTDNGVQVIVEDWALLSEQTGLSMDALKILLAEYGLLFDGIEASAQDLYAAADAINAVKKDGKIDLAKMIVNRAVAGETEQQIWDLVNSLLAADERGELDLDIDTSDPEAAKDLIERIIALAVELSGKEYDVDIEVEDKASAVLDEVLRKLDKMPGYKKIQVESVYTETKATQDRGYSEMRTWASGTDSAEGGKALVNEEGAELIQEGNRARIAGGGLPTITNLQKGAKVWTAKETAAILGNSNLDELYDGIQAFAGGSNAPKKVYTTKFDDARLGADTSDNKWLKKLQEFVSLRKSELELIEATGGSITRQIKKQKGIQNALVLEIDHLKNIGGSQEDINKLTTEWYEIQSKIADLEKNRYMTMQEAMDNLEKAVEKRIDDINKKRDKELDKVQKRIDKAKEEHDLQSKTNELKEKELAVEKAREALANAKKQRTVRIFNAAKGRWEWTYNASEVASAREELSSARKSLSEYKAEERYNAKIARLEAAQEKIRTKYNEQTEKWQKVLDAMEEPVKSIRSALNTIEKNATKEMLPTIRRINKALSKMGKRGISTDKLYDSGGVLSGIGGIKGTRADELILPPDITSKMLKPAATSAFAKRLSELRYLYGVTGSLAGYTNNAIGSQHNGDVYTFGNITLSKEQARSTTVYELARMASGLRSYSSAM